VTAAVEAAGVSQRYGRHWALRECCLRLPEGRVVALVGPNGAGKTTLLAVIVGLARPSAGELRVLGDAVIERQRHSGGSGSWHRTLRSIGGSPRRRCCAWGPG
jgi:ABC-type multidrug transport system ATPase subunit